MSSITENHNYAILKQIPEGYTKQSFCEEANQLSILKKTNEKTQKIFKATPFLSKNFLFGFWEGILVSVLQGLGWRVLLTKFIASCVTPYLRENIFEQTNESTRALNRAFHHMVY